MVFKILDHQAMKDTDFWDMRNKWSEPNVSPQYYLRGVARPHTDRESPGGVQLTPWVEETKLRVWGDQGSCSSQYGVSERKDLHRGQCRYLQSAPLEYSAEFRSLHACGETTESQKKITQLVSDASAQWTLRGKNSSCTHLADWKLQYLHSTEYNTQKGLSSVVGNN